APLPSQTTRDLAADVPARPTSKKGHHGAHTDLTPGGDRPRRASRAGRRIRAPRRPTRGGGAEGALHRGHTLRRLRERRGHRTEDLHGREQLTPVFAALKQYEVTMHFNGQSTVSLNGERATGETYCIAHHVFSGDGERKIMLAYLRYLDTFVKQGCTWLFAERNLYLEFSDTRTLGG